MLQLLPPFWEPQNLPKEKTVPVSSGCTPRASLAPASWHSVDPAGAVPNDDTPWHGGGSSAKEKLCFYIVVLPVVLTIKKLASIFAILRRRNWRLTNKDKDFTIKHRDFSRTTSDLINDTEIWQESVWCFTRKHGDVVVFIKVNSKWMDA